MNRAMFEEMDRYGETYWWYKGKKAMLCKLVKKYGARFMMSNYPQGVPNVLDIGCGAGNMFDFLIGFGRLTALELSADALDYARRGNGFSEVDPESTVSFVRGKVEDLPFSSGGFTIVASFDNLEHVEDDSHALKEIRRVIAEDGILLLTVPSCRYLWTLRDVQLGHRRRYGYRQLKNSLENAGFKVEKITYGYMCLFPVLLAKAIKDRLLPPPKTLKSDIRTVREPWNRWLSRWLEFEAMPAAAIGLPVGTSLFVIARPK